MKEEELKANYDRTRQELEKQEEDIKRFKNKGVQLFEEAREELLYYLQGFEDLDGEIVNQAMREFAQREEEYLDVLSKERQAILQKQEDADEKYYSDLRKLTNEKENK